MVLHISVLMVTRPVKDKGEAALTVRTAGNPRSSCQEELGRNALILSPEMSFATFLV